MNQGLASALLLAFGVAVGVIGVIAYLRMLRKEKTAAHLPDDAPPDRSRSLEEKSEAEQNGMKD
ncbi:hypothetical protein D3P08_01500 [Paenibacillus nanensis]|uniref:Uncharacterized protein n=1 Tax=Paenibacillus nanensis TaxID=393251 RepID=A0A3A1VKK1_9BACL|nr:hypothetical protein [Paenibacillus nanensis]RIX60272.1 hypothetical protein D3P08_01500 [Paenibacillus nanensis]